ncbi:hypothetical protein N9N67_07730 [Bacteriovoracaceae bacterium]|nr:hypothetical protein [Bacteriovoracaceae bacterium]
MHINEGAFKKVQNHLWFICLTLILFSASAFSQLSSDYKQNLSKTKEKLLNMKQDPLAVIPSLMEHLTTNPDNTYFKYEYPYAHDHVMLNHFTKIMVIDGLGYNFTSILHAHEYFYPGLFDHLLKVDVPIIRKNPNMDLARKVELRLCALFKQEHKRKYGKLFYRTMCKEGHELNDYFKREIKDYLQKRSYTETQAIKFRKELPSYVRELNTDIQNLNGRCSGIKHGYEELRNMSMTDFAKSVTAAGYPQPTKMLGTGSGSNYSSSGTHAERKRAALKDIRQNKIDTYFSVQTAEIEGLVDVVKNHKLIYFYFSEKFAKGMGEFSLDKCFKEGKGLNYIRGSHIKVAAKEMLYDKLHHQLIKFLGHYEDLRGEQGKTIPNMALINSVIKKMVRLSPLSVSSVINRMHIADAAVYMKHLSYLVIMMTKSKNARDSVMRVTRKIYSIGWVVGIALQLTGFPPAMLVGKVINGIAWGAFAVNKIVNMVDYAFTAKGLRYTRMAGTAGTMEIDVALHLQDYYKEQSGRSWKEIKSLLWELPLMLAGEGFVNFAKVRNAFRPLFYNLDDLTRAEAINKLHNLTDKYTRNMDRINKLSKREIENLAVILGEGANPQVMKTNMAIWMNVDDITFKFMQRKLSKMKRIELIKFKNRTFNMAEPFASLLKGDWNLLFLHNSVMKHASFGGMAKHMVSRIGTGGRKILEKHLGPKSIKNLDNVWWYTKDFFYNLYSFARIKHKIFKGIYWMMQRYNYNGRFSGYFALKYRDYMNRALERGYITLEQVKKVVNEEQIHEELQKFYMKYFIDANGNLKSVVSLGAVKPNERVRLIKQFVQRYGKRSKEMGVFSKEVQEYLRTRLTRCNLGADELNILVANMYKYEIHLKSVGDARLLMDYIRDISRYAPWQKVGAMKNLDRLFRHRKRGEAGENLTDVLPYQYFKVNPIKSFYGRRSEYFVHKDWLTRRLTRDYTQSGMARSEAVKKAKFDASRRSRAVQEMKLGCSARAGSIFRNYAKKSYNSFAISMGMGLSVMGYGMQNWGKEKNAEWVWRFTWDMTFSYLGKLIGNNIFMNTQTTMWGKWRSDNMFSALKDLPEAKLNVLSTDFVKMYIDGTIKSPVPEDILKDKDFQAKLYTIHDAFTHKVLNADDDFKDIIAKLQNAQDVNDVVYALSQQKEYTGPDQKIYDELQHAMAGYEDFNHDIFTLLEELEYTSRMQMKEYGLNTGSATMDRFTAHRLYSIPMAFASYGVSQAIYYNLCWGIRNPAAAYTSSIIGFFSITLMRANLYYWWMNQTNITQ